MTTSNVAAELQEKEFFRIIKKLSGSVMDIWVNV
jgi:hypothetical protein